MGQLESIWFEGAEFMLHCVAERQEIARQSTNFRGASVAYCTAKHLYSAF
ncbi:hypothetical protein [Cupriavidus necator]